MTTRRCRHLADRRGQRRGAIPTNRRGSTEHTERWLAGPASGSAQQWRSLAGEPAQPVRWRSGSAWCRCGRSCASVTLPHVSLAVSVADAAPSGLPACSRCPLPPCGLTFLSLSPAVYPRFYLVALCLALSFSSSSRRPQCPLGLAAPSGRPEGAGTGTGRAAWCLVASLLDSAARLGSAQPGLLGSARSCCLHLALMPRIEGAFINYVTRWRRHLRPRMRPTPFSARKPRGREGRANKGVTAM